MGVHQQTWNNLPGEKTPKSLTPLLVRRGDQIVAHRTGFYSQMQKKAFQKLVLMRGTRALINSHIVYQMFRASATEDLEVSQESVTDSQ